MHWPVALIRAGANVEYRAAATMRGQKNRRYAAFRLAAVGCGYCKWRQIMKNGSLRVLAMVLTADPDFVEEKGVGRVCGLVKVVAQAAVFLARGID